uniref:UPF3 domain-containing protein n=1 Tax=Monopterus albus TaxID=43700 RepID=A0A3Q3IIT4_MONAL
MVIFVSLFKLSQKYIAMYNVTATSHHPVYTADNSNWSYILQTYVITCTTFSTREKYANNSLQVVIRRLPPNLSKEQLQEQLSPLPSYDYFEFFPADQSLYPHLFSRAYINFKNLEDILLFRDRFDGYVFIDNKGQEYPAVVEFAPFQKISKKKLKKKDAKAGSIEEGTLSLSAVVMVFSL